MLDTEEADALCAELECAVGIFGSIRIGADSEPAVFVDDVHKLDEERILACVHGVDLGTVDEALAAVKGEPLAFLVDLVGSFEGNGLRGEVDLHRLAAHDAALAPATCNECPSHVQRVQHERSFRHGW